MSDIYISYKREDYPKARKLATALESQGWTVWWDPKLRAGQNFDKSIEAALKQSKCVIVMWSERAVESDWVLAEATWALNHKKLVPVAVEDVKVPFRFQGIHTRRLIEGNALEESSDFRKLVGDISSILGPSPMAVAAEEEQRRLEAEVQRKAEQEANRAHLEEKWIPSEVVQSRQTGSAPRRPAPVPEEVHLGAAAPRAVCPGEEFVARVAAYTAAHRSKVWQVIAEEAPSAQPRLDLETCRWHRGTKVTVRVDAHHVKVSNPIQTFEWNGAWCVLRFDAKVPVDIEVNTVILRIDIAVEGLPIIAIRPEIAVSRKDKENETARSLPVIEQSAPRTAFASYAKKDRRDVLGRVRSLQIFTGINVFLDCLSIRPSEEWKAKLKTEIRDRDVFWLFWSRNAMASEWVKWEWQTALAEKSLAKIQAHPLEPSELAPPPKELSSLQFGAMYEWYVSHLRESPITRVFRPLFHNAASFYEAYSRWCFAVAVAIIIGAFALYIYSFAF